MSHYFPDWIRSNTNIKLDFDQTNCMTETGVKYVTGFVTSKLVKAFIFPRKNTDPLKALEKPKLDLTRFDSNALVSHEIVKYFRSWHKQKLQRVWYQGSEKKDDWSYYWHFNIKCGSLKQDSNVIK